MANSGCIDIDIKDKKNKQIVKNGKEFIRLSEQFESDSAIEQFGEQATGMWWRLVDSVVGDYTSSRDIPNVEQLKILQRVVNRQLKAIKKDRGWFAKWLYLPQEIFKDIDGVDRWYKEMQKSHQTYKGNTSFFNSQVNEIVRLLKEDAFTIGTKDYLKRFKPGSKNKAQKELTRLYKQYNKLKQQKKFDVAETLYVNEIDPFVQTGEGVILRKFHELASAPRTGKGNFDSLIKKKSAESKGTKNEYDQRVIDAAEIWRRKIQPEGTKMLIQGIKNLKNGLTKGNIELKRMDNYNKTVRNLDNILKRYENKELQANGYFPVLTFDVLPSLMEASKVIHETKNPEMFQKGAEIIEGLQKTLDENIYTNKHLGEQNNKALMIDYNVFPIMDSYIRNVSRFNYVSFNTSKYMELMKDLHATQERGNDVALNKKINFLQGYISDTYSMVSGSRYDKSPVGSTIARGITSFQFASKLGLNIRGAARNSTQSLFNYIYFGGTGIMETKRMMQNADMKTRVDYGLANNGVLFPEIQEIYAQKLTKTVLDKKTGIYREVIDLSMGDNITESMARVAEKLGKPMQWVENNINRRYTFQLGYTKQWSADSHTVNKQIIKKQFNRKLKKQLKDEGSKETVEQLEQSVSKEYTIFKNKDSTRYEYEFELFRRERAENFGNSVVNKLHFDYSMTAKSKALSTWQGSILGQFQHYGLNFFNLQRKIVRDGTDSVFTNQWDTPAAWKMYRLGILYTAVNGILAPLFNVNLGNLIQNDTLERADNYRKVFLGEEEEKKRAFFGKGPVIGTVGGPFISDMVNLGNIFGLYNMDEDSALAYLAGYQDMSENTTNEKTEEVMRLINTQGHRLVYSTIPKWSEGVNLGVLLEGELGLFPNEKQKATRKMIGLDSKKNKPKKKKDTSPDYNKAILDSLKAMQNIK
jgi:hypothetical protein